MTAAPVPAVTTTFTLLVSTRSVPLLSTSTVAVRSTTVESETIVWSEGAVILTVTALVGVTIPVPPAPPLPAGGRYG